jgi:hypothetical protein
MAKRPAGIDQATLRVMERMVRMPPKPHDEMKLGKKPNAKKKPSPKRKRARGA